MCESHKKQRKIGDFFTLPSGTGSLPTTTVSKNSDFVQLAEIARLNNFQVIPTKSNGDCMFEALAEQLDIKEPKQLRTDLMTYLKNHLEIVSQVDFYAEEKMSFTDYVDNMSKPGVWGDGIVLEVAVTMFQRPIAVFHSDGKVIYVTSREIPPIIKPLRLAFVPAVGCGQCNHYVSVRECDSPVSNWSNAACEGHLGTSHDAEQSQDHKASYAFPCDIPQTPSLLDIGDYIQPNHELSDEVKMKLLTTCWSPDNTYNFKSDTIGKRAFRLSWLSEYPWLSYSSSQQGALCRYCVVFPQHVDRVLQGAFIVTAFKKYKDFHEAARNHARSAWHRASHEDAVNFTQSKSMEQQLNTIKAKTVAENRLKLFPILSSIVFCGTHDIALRGKVSSSGNFHDLIDFRVESGDKLLENHLQTSPGNAKYTSHRVQTELIELCGSVLGENIVQSVNKSRGYSILADETTDISGHEQLSLAVRYYAEDVQNIPASSPRPGVREEFLGFVQLQDRSAAGIAQVIEAACHNFGLNMQKLIGQGYDGCSTMAGKEGGVQAIIRAKYPKAVFVHCSSHRLNLVVNDLNKLPEVRNAVGTIKSVISFFRESAQRRRLLPNIPLLCETRWTLKYRSIRVFAENFTEFFLNWRILPSLVLQRPEALLITFRVHVGRPRSLWC